VHDSEADSYITALDARTGEEIGRTSRPNAGFPRSSWATPFVWANEKRIEIVTLGHGLIISYGLDGKELAGGAVYIRTETKLYKIGAQSHRNATIGSTLVARRAGIQHAASAIIANRSAAPA
jgi:hypothetical protein